ncbi:MAG: penicillin-binding protein [Bacteroidota bacterium]
MKKVSNHILGRVYILMGVFILFGVAILLRVVAIQFDKDKWVQKEMEEQVSFKKMVADRGNILSDDGTILATSLPFYKVAIDPFLLDTMSFESFSDSLYKLSLLFTTHFDKEENRDTLKVYRSVMHAIATKDRHVYLSRKKLNFAQLEDVKTWPILRRDKYEGGLAQEKFHNERFYPMGDLARITLGRLIDDTLALRGIEYSFNKELRGRDGYFLAQKVVGKSYIPLDEFGKEPTTDGLDVVTTLDVDMQDVVERALRKGVEHNFAKYGTAILMEVETGKVKAIANWPETFNNAVATQIEPGSTFKLASAVALMEDGLLEICDTIKTGNGTILYDDKEVTDGGKAWGDITFEQVFAHSSNVGVSKTIHEFYREQPQRYINYLYSFGFGNIVNTQLVGEPVPQIIKPGDKEWNIATLPSLSYGYSLEVTPLQMATFYNGVANNGKLLRPWIVSEIRDDSKRMIQYRPEILNPKMCSEETIVKVKELMKAVVSYGTAKRAFKKIPFEVAGKTGTARKTKRGVGYIKKYRASFGGFFPANDPRFTLYVMVDEPDGGLSSGGRVAAPIFREIAEAVYKIDQELSQPPSNLNRKPSRKPAAKIVHANTIEQVYPKLGIATSNNPGGEWIQAKGNGHQINLAALEREEDLIPDVKGMSGRDALLMLERMGIEVKVKGMGRVKRQSLLPGYRINEETSITLFLGKT